MAEFPRDWQVDTIGSLVEIETGSKNTQDKEDGGDYPFYVRSDTVERINCYTHDTEGVVTAGDGVGTGKVFHFVKGKFALHQRCYLMHQFKPVLDPQYFYWFFKTYFYDRITSMTAKSSVDSVRREMIAGMQIAYPDIPEQRRIADALDSVDKLIDNLSRRIEKKRQVKQGVMQELLTGKKRFPGFDGSWTQNHLGCVVHFQKGELLSSKNFCNGIIPVIAGGQNPAGFHSVSNRTGVSVTISASGAYAGYVAMHEGPIFASDCTTIGESDQYDVRYVYYWLKLNQSSIYECQRGGAQPHVNGKDLAPLPISMPEDISEQHAIALVLGNMDAEIAKLEAKRDKYIDIKQGMMNDLLTGKVRI